VFRLNSKKVTAYKCVIENLSGITVFSGEGSEITWDGTDSSQKKVPKGIYNYEIEALTNSGQTVSRSGKILII
jgi:flagellar hook assembly protein FlgD